MANFPVKPLAPKPLAVPRVSPPAAVSGTHHVAEDSFDVQVDAPLVTIEELADLRARLARAEARVKELEQPRPLAIPPPASSNPFLEAAPIVPATPAAAAPFTVPRAAPIPISIRPGGAISIMPFDGAKKRRRAIIAVVTILLLVVAAILTVTIVSRV
jgi:hypothetical protein